MLNRVDLTPLRSLAVDGACGPATIGAIEEFQRRYGKSMSPSGRMEPGDAMVELLRVESAKGQTPGPLDLSFINQLGAPWMAVAEGERGVAEWPDSGRVPENPRIVAYHQTTGFAGTSASQSDETAWCASFVNWCLQQVGLVGQNTPSAGAWRNWGTQCEAR